jgi:hypothetical protein
LSEREVLAYVDVTGSARQMICGLVLKPRKCFDFLMQGFYSAARPGSIAPNWRHLL